MEDRLIELLEEFNYPVYRQGSFSEDEEYPDTFITYWNTDSPDHAHYDNTEYGTAWAFDINVYSNDAEITYNLLSEIRTLLKQNKWIVPGKGYDVLSDEPTHTGRGIESYFLEV